MGKPAEHQENMVQENLIEDNNMGTLTTENLERHSSQTMEAGRGMDEQVLEYIPPRRELLQQYEINIRFLSVGCVIQVGCKSIPFNSVELALKELAEYTVNPYESTKKWIKIIDENK